jgi:hypothetical protein
MLILGSQTRNTASERRPLEILQNKLNHHNFTKNQNWANHTKLYFVRQGGLVPNSIEGLVALVRILNHMASVATHDCWAAVGQIGRPMDMVTRKEA